MAFSPQALQTIRDFAANLGLPAAPAADGSYSFVFQHSGTLTLTSSADGMRTLVSLRARPHRLDSETEERLMLLAGPDITTERFLSAGLTRDNEIMVAVGVEEAELSVPTLETCIRQLVAARSAIP